MTIDRCSHVATKYWGPFCIPCICDRVFVNRLHTHVMDSIVDDYNKGLRHRNLNICLCHRIKFTGTGIVFWGRESCFSIGGV